MRVWRDFKEIDLRPGQRTVLTLGNFDGMHRGHLHVIEMLRKAAAAAQLLSVVVTFEPHPRKVHNPERAFSTIMSLEQRLGILEKCGVDAVLVISYTLDFSCQSPEEFVKATFVDALHAQIVIAGHDMRFGRNNSGDGKGLSQLGDKYAFSVLAADMKKAQNGRIRYSSTQVRRFLDEGKVSEAGRYLGRNHVVCGEVVHGYARGRELGFPTANLEQASQGYVPADGIYAGWLSDGRRRHPAAISIGTNPTFPTVRQRQVEAYVVDRPQGEPLEAFNLYGKTVCLEFVERLRGMTTYEDRGSLIRQMSKDVEFVMEILGV